MRLHPNERWLMRTVWKPQRRTYRARNYFSPVEYGRLKSRHDQILLDANRFRSRASRMERKAVRLRRIAARYRLALLRVEKREAWGMVLVIIALLVALFA